MTENLIKSSQHPSIEVSSLQSISDDIEALDYKILSIGETLKGFSAVTHMFSYDKEKLDGDDLYQMALRCRDIYIHLMNRIEYLQKFGRLYLSRCRIEGGDVNMRAAGGG